MDVPCPEFVLKYNQHMNGADVHDQKRLQRFSIQTHVRYKKYYKSIALGLFDIALVNMYVLHEESMKKTKKRSMTHAQWRRQLANELIEVGREIMDDKHVYGSYNEPIAPIVPVHTPNPDDHVLVRTTETRGPGVRNQRKQRACRVCSMLRSQGRIQRGRDTTTFCKKCTDEKGPSAPAVFLCSTPRQELGGLSCFRYYHLKNHIDMNEYRSNKRTWQDVDKGDMSNKVKSRKPPQKRKKQATSSNDSSSGSDYINSEDTCSSEENNEEFLEF